MPLYEVVKGLPAAMKRITLPLPPSCRSASHPIFRRGRG